MTQRPLDGIRVLDFTRVLSGPHATRMLCDLGAEVIKVESPDGDVSRTTNPRINGLATYFVQQNVGKRSISLDIDKGEAVELLLRLADRCDVIVENFRPGRLAEFGLDYDTAETISALPEIAELNTGYFMMGEALFTGLCETVRQMRAAMALQRMFLNGRALGENGPPDPNPPPPSGRFRPTSQILHLTMHFVRIRLASAIALWTWSFQFHPTAPSSCSVIISARSLGTVCSGMGECWKFPLLILAGEPFQT